MLLRQAEKHLIVLDSSTLAHLRMTGLNFTLKLMQVLNT